MSGASFHDDDDRLLQAWREIVDSDDLRPVQMTRAVLRPLVDEIERLHRWKREARVVLDEWESVYESACNATRGADDPPCEPPLGWTKPQIVKLELALQARMLALLGEHHSWAVAWADRAALEMCAVLDDNDESGGTAVSPDRVVTLEALIAEWHDDGEDDDDA